MLVLAEFPLWGTTLIVITILVMVIVLILKFVPIFKLHKEEKEEKEFAKETIDTYIVKPKEKTILKEEIIAYLQKREQELGIILTDIDIDSLIVQIKQDYKDFNR